MTKWYPVQVKAFVDLGDTRRLCKVIKLNNKTAWVKIMLGARTSITIKRHRVKHNLLGYCRIRETKGRFANEIIHTTPGNDTVPAEAVDVPSEV